MSKENERTEFQEALQALIDRGDLNLEGRHRISYPMTIPTLFEAESIDIVTQDVRSLNAMRRADIHTVGDLIQRWDTLNKLRNVGTKTLKNIRNSFMNAYYCSLSVDDRAKFLGKIIQMNKGIELEEE